MQYVKNEWIKMWSQKNAWIMLGAQGILPTEDVATILDGLKQLNAKAEAGELEFTVANEDIHLNLEKMLIDLIGPVGGKLHTGRSRNDQVATDMIQCIIIRRNVIEHLSDFISIWHSL